MQDKAENAHHHEKMDRLRSTTDITVLKNMIKPKALAKVPLMANSTGQVTFESTLETLLNEHFPGSTNKPRNETSPTTKKIKKNKLAFTHLFVNKDTVREAFKKFGSFKSPGPDGVYPVLLQNLTEDALEQIVLYYRASLGLAYQPKSWRASKVIFIPKDKPSHEGPRDFRPITLASYLLKGLERVVLWQQEQTTLKRFPLSKWQHAFRSGKSSESALSEVQITIEEVAANEEHCLLLGIDIKGAFDTVKIQSVMNAMKRKGFQPWFIDWYGYYLDHRSISTEFGGITMV
jgi:hypothetical protein